MLWYNRSRLYSRICPACYRLYTAGSALIPHVKGSADSLQNLPQVVPEQILSGLCESSGATFPSEMLYFIENLVYYMY